MSEPTASPHREVVRVGFAPGNVWRAGLVLTGVLALALTLQFVFTRGSLVLYALVMAWFASLAMEPAVRRLARHMPRPLSTAVVMVTILAFGAVLLTLFGQLFITQMASLVRSLPGIVEEVLSWVSEQFDQQVDLQTILDSINLTPEQAAGYAGQIAGGVIVLLVGLAGGIAQFLMLLLFSFYLSADGPRLRRWIAELFPPKQHRVSLVVWDTMAEKIGRYVAARVVLAAINATASAIVFAILGVPSWLPLAIWTGLVAQFVPAIGTYLSIILPALVGLLSPNPWLGALVLAWGILYQQVENLTFEPRISARAVNVHPAVSFASVILGTSLFGVPGALLAVPVAAMLLTLLDLYRKRYEPLPPPDPGLDPVPDLPSNGAEPTPAEAEPSTKA